VVQPTGEASMKGPFADQGIEGPGYADRIKGRLTFRDWDHWAEEDREEYRAEFTANDRPAVPAPMSDDCGRSGKLK
jgi:hypothetical protein